MNKCNELTKISYFSKVIHFEQYISSVAYQIFLVKKQELDCIRLVVVVAAGSCKLLIIVKGLGLPVLLPNVNKH